MSGQEKKWMGLAAVGSAIAVYVTRLLRRSDRSQKPAVPSDVRS